MGSNDSFDSDQQREIAMLDQQWNDLVSHYIEDPQLMNLPTSDDGRYVMSHQYNTANQKNENYMSMNNQSSNKKTNKTGRDDHSYTNKGFFSKARRP